MTRRMEQNQPFSSRWKLRPIPGTGRLRRACTGGSWAWRGAPVERVTSRRLDGLKQSTRPQKSTFDTSEVAAIGPSGHRATNNKKTTSIANDGGADRRNTVRRFSTYLGVLLQRGPRFPDDILGVGVRAAEGGFDHI